MGYQWPYREVLLSSYQIEHTQAPSRTENEVTGTTLDQIPRCFSSAGLLPCSKIMLMSTNQPIKREGIPRFPTDRASWWPPGTLSEPLTLQPGCTWKPLREPFKIQMAGLNPRPINWDSLLPPLFKQIPSLAVQVPVEIPLQSASTFWRGQLHQEELYQG